MDPLTQCAGCNHRLNTGCRGASPGWSVRLPNVPRATSQTQEYVATFLVVTSCNVAHLGACCPLLCDTQRQQQPSGTVLNSTPLRATSSCAPLIFSATAPLLAAPPCTALRANSAPPTTRCAVFSCSTHSTTYSAWAPLKTSELSAHTHAHPLPLPRCHRPKPRSCHMAPPHRAVCALLRSTLKQRFRMGRRAWLGGRSCSGM